jgi:hypothetical protein
MNPAEADRPLDAATTSFKPVLSEDEVRQIIDAVREPSAELPADLEPASYWDASTMAPLNTVSAVSPTTRLVPADR